MATSSLPVRTMRYGADADLPARRTLHAGPVTLTLENADLRYVRFGQAHIVLRLYMAVRDLNWSTIEPRFTRFEVDDRGDSFHVELSGEHLSDDVDFAWTGTIDGYADGTIRYQMDGAPRKTFLKNRIGFCVLHPMELAGLPATVETPDGTIHGEFPALISPHQPFIDMRSISHPAGPDGTALIQFEGDLFEVEDQRNWTDASYKTYSTPLRLPYPVEVTPETRIVQSVTISFTGTPPAAEAGAGGAADVTVRPDELQPLPPIGYGAGRKPLPAQAVGPLRRLAPDHLWIDLDLNSERWRERLGIAAANAAQVDAPLHLSVIGGPGETGWSDLAAAIRDASLNVTRVFAFPPVKEPIIFPRFDLATHPETIAAAKQAFDGTGIAVGGGTRAYFTELNRATDFLPVAKLDGVTYTINAQVHASDNLSVVETLAAQAATVESARAIAGDRTLLVGPVTLKPPYNPNATSAPSPAGPDRLPDPVDPRQLSLFAASWTIGSLHQLATAGADVLTYFELAGWRGLIEKSEELTRRALFPSIPGGAFPLYHVFAAAAEFAGGQIAAVSLADGLRTEALALRADNRVRVLAGSFSEEPRQVRIAIPGAARGSVRVLDETTYAAAAADPSFFTTGGDEIEGNDGFTVTLPPFAVARIDTTIA